ncbi:MAG: DoxX family protein, partial [Tannerella sp.]|nr:DoxX family protein [Tannerella sp.]
MEAHSSSNLQKWGALALSVLRMAIGWHFLYEGIAKIASGSWSAEAYLANTTGFFSPFYHWIADSSAMGVVNWLNIIGLILIGLALFLGFFPRIAAVTGAFLLLLYYFAYPPFGFSLINSSSESHLYIINYQLAEAIMLILIAVFPYTGYSVENWLRSLFAKKPQEASVSEDSVRSRREAIKNLASIPILGVMGWGAYENNRRYGIDVMSGATIQLNRKDLSELKGDLPRGKIGNHELSRLIMGGNLIGGWSHGRDLIYTDQLFKAYNNERKVYETLSLGEAAGINAINIGFPSNDLLRKYKKATGSKIKVISQIAADVKDESNLFEAMYGAIKFGVEILQIQGNWVDWMTRDQHLDRVGRLLDKIKEEGFTAGLGAHTIDSLIACKEAGIIPDYYMKTMHHDQYWSATPRENRVPFEQDGPVSPDHNRYHQNIFDGFPDRTVEFINSTDVPVMGFKVLAAGAIEPADGFNWAFQNG